MDSLWRKKAKSRYSLLRLRSECSEQISNFGREKSFTVMPKSQVKFLVAYCVVMLVLTQFLRHSTRFNDFVEPVAALLGSVLPIAISVFAIMNGWVLGRVRMVDRDENPISYWLLVILGLVLGAYLLVQGIRGLIALASA